MNRTDIPSDVLAFLENFHVNCRNNPRLDSVQTSYFGHWVAGLLGKEREELPSDGQIHYIKGNVFLPHDKEP
jgi:hypothetical protein